MLVNINDENFVPQKSIYERTEIEGLEDWSFKPSKGERKVNGRTYEVYTKDISHSFGWKFMQGIKAFAATFFSLGFGLFRKDVLLLWQQAVTGVEQRKIRVTPLDEDSRINKILSQNVPANESNRSSSLDSPPLSPFSPIQSPESEPIPQEKPKPSQQDSPQSSSISQSDRESNEELKKSILAIVQNEKYSEITSLIKQKNLSKQTEAFDELFQSISEQVGKNHSPIVHLRYQCITIIFMWEVLSESTQLSSSLLGRNNVSSLDEMVNSAQKDVLAMKQQGAIKHFSNIIDALILDDSNKLYRIIKSINRAYSSTQKSLGIVSECQEEIIQSGNHYANFKRSLLELETMAQRFGEIAEEIALLDVNQLKQRLSQISVEAP